MKRNFVKPTALILGIITVALLSVTYVSAQDSGNYPPIVQKIAERFNLNESDVQKVFDEEREEHHADMQARWAEKLDGLVQDGKITPGQKDAIIKKQEEMHNNMLGLTDLSPEERKEKMIAFHGDLKEWADKEGIELPLLGPFKFGFREGMHGGKMMVFSERI